MPKQNEAIRITIDFPDKVVSNEHFNMVTAHLHPLHTPNPQIHLARSPQAHFPHGLTPLPTIPSSVA